MPKQHILGWQVLNSFNVKQTVKCSQLIELRNLRFDGVSCFENNLVIYIPNQRKIYKYLYSGFVAIKLISNGYINKNHINVGFESFQAVHFKHLEKQHDILNSHLCYNIVMFKTEGKEQCKHFHNCVNYINSFSNTSQIKRPWGMSTRLRLSLPVILLTCCLTIQPMYQFLLHFDIFANKMKMSLNTWFKLTYRKQNFMNVLTGGKGGNSSGN